MTGNAPDLARLRRAGARARRAAVRRRRARLRRDRRARADELCDYGIRGNSSIRHLGESYENIVLVGGFSKAYSSLLAFIACPTPLKQVLKTAAPPYLYSGPSPVASLATVLEGLRVNDARGEQLRAKLHRLTARVLDALAELGITRRTSPASRSSRSRWPNADAVDEVGDLLFDRGIYVTMAVYPLVPREEVGFRLQLTAANTDEQVEQLCTSSARSPSASSCSGRRGRVSRQPRGHDASRPARQSPPPPVVDLPPVRGGRLRALRVRAAAQGQRPGDQRARPVRRRSASSPASASTGRRRASPGGASPLGLACSGWATSTPTATRSCSAPTCRSRRSATPSTWPSTRC